MKYIVTHPNCLLGEKGEIVEIKEPSERAKKFLEPVKEKKPEDKK